MRRLSLGNPLPTPDGFKAWTENSLREIERASVDDVQAILSEFSVTGTYSETRTLNASTATLGNVIAFIGTMLSDIQKRGQKRSYGT